MTGAAPDGLLLRRMRPADLTAVTRIEADRHPVDAWPSMAFAEAIEQPDRYECLVAERPPAPGDRPRSGDLVAYGVISMGGNVADLDNLTVRADAARRGIGRWLLRSLLEAASARGAREVLLEVRHDNDPAIALYASAGFREINRRRGYYAPGLDAIVMRRPVAPVGAGRVDG